MLDCGNFGVHASGSRDHTRFSEKFSEGFRECFSKGFMGIAVKKVSRKGSLKEFLEGGCLERPFWRVRPLGVFPRNDGTTQNSLIFAALLQGRSSVSGNAIARILDPLEKIKTRASDLCSGMEDYERGLLTERICRISKSSNSLE